MAQRITNSLFILLICLFSRQGLAYENESLEEVVSISKTHLDTLNERLNSRQGSSCNDKSVIEKGDCTSALDTPTKILLMEKINYVINHFSGENHPYSMKSIVDSTIREIAKKRGSELDAVERRQVSIAISALVLKMTRQQSTNGEKTLALLLTNIKENRDPDTDTLNKYATLRGLLPTAATAKFQEDKRLFSRHLNNLKNIGIDFDPEKTKQDNKNVYNGFTFENFNLDDFHKNEKLYKETRKSLEFIFPKAYAYALMDRNRKEVLQLGGNALLPPIDRGDGLNITSMPTRTYEKRVKSFMDNFRNNIRNSMENMKEATDYFTGMNGMTSEAFHGVKESIAGLFRGNETKKEKKKRLLRERARPKDQFEESSSAADSYMRSAHKDLHHLKVMGVNKEILTALRKYEMMATRQQGDQISEFYNKAENAQWAIAASAAVPVVLYAGTVLGGTAAMSAITGGKTAAVVGTTNGLAIATSKMAMLGLAFGVGAPALNASIDRFHKGGSFSCHFANEWYEKGGATGATNTTLMLAAIPPAIGALTVVGATAGFTAPSIYIGGNLAVGSYFALEMAKTGGEQFYQCYKYALEVMLIPEGPMQNKLANYYSAEAWKQCAAGVISMGFAVVGARSARSQMKSTSKNMRENFVEKNGREPTGRDIWEMIREKKSNNQSPTSELTLNSPEVVNRAMEVFKRENGGFTPGELAEVFHSMATRRLEVIKSNILTEMNRPKPKRTKAETSTSIKSGNTITDPLVGSTLKNFVSKWENGKTKKYRAGECPAAARDVLIELTSIFETRHLETRIINENGNVFNGSTLANPELVQVRIQGEWVSVASRSHVKLPGYHGGSQGHVITKIKMPNGEIRIIDPTLHPNLADAIGSKSPIHHESHRKVFTPKEHAEILESALE